jgi:predicted DNA-binding transcriptional regulator AlpA
MERYLKTSAAAQYLGVTPKSLYHRVAGRTIPYSKVGKSLVFDAVLIDQWVASKRVNTKPPWRSGSKWK